MDQIDLKKLTSTKFCFALNVNMTSRKLSRFYDEALSEVGLTNNQFSLLSLIAMKEGQSIVDLANTLLIQHSAMSRNVKKLSELGLIEEYPSTEDGRIKLLRISRTGEEILMNGYKIWSQLHEKTLNLFRSNPVDFLAQLRELRSAIELLEDDR